MLQEFENLELHNLQQNIANVLFLVAISDITQLNRI